MQTFDRVVLLALASLVLLVAAGMGAGVQPPATGLALSALLTALLFCVLAVGLASLRPGAPGATARRLGLGPGRLPAWSVALLCLGAVAVSNAIEVLIHMARMQDVGTLRAIDEALEGTRGPGLGFAVFAIAFAAAVGEELFFRGWLQRGLERRLERAPGGALLAIVLASLLFGLAHWDRVHGPAAFALGLYLGAAAWLSGGVRAPIACHVVNNLAAVGDSALGLRLHAPASLTLAGGAATAAAALLIAWRLRGTRGGAPAPADAAQGQPLGPP